MSLERVNKIEERIREIAASFIEEASNKTALITVTRVALEERGKHATIFVSVLPVTGEDSAINFLKRKRKELKKVVMKQLGIHPVPFLDVAIDTGEKARQTIDALLQQDVKDIE
jgi:ribosome-binding factor A